MESATKMVGDIKTVLEELQSASEAPMWMSEEGLTTLMGGYLLEGETPKGMYNRMSKIASKLLVKPELETKFFEIFWKGWFCPSTPVASNFGSIRGLPISCYGGICPDSTSGIFKSVHEIAMLSKNGGGCSISMHPIRGRGEPISGGGASDGIVGWLKVIDQTISIVSQGGIRRGAIATYLPIEHTDFDEFISIRRQTGDETRKCRSIGFHHGVTITDEFMEKLELGDTEARRRWELLLQTRFETGEPYIIWSDTANKNKPNTITKEITHSNLCITGSQRVVSDRGYLTAKDLYEQGGELNLFDGVTSVRSSEMKLREKDADVYKITLSNGLEHEVTDYHLLPVMGNNGNITMTQYKNLKVGDKIAIQINKGLFGNTSMEDEAFLLGLYQSDGTQYKDIRFIDIWENDFDLIEEIEFKLDSVYKKYTFNKYIYSKRVIDSPKFMNCKVNTGNVKKKRIQSNKLHKLDFNKGYIPSWIWESNEKTQWSYVRGLLYADGTVSQNKTKGESIQICYSDINEGFLKELQLLFNNLGLQSSIHLIRKAGKSLLSDGKGGRKYYTSKACYGLIITNKNSALEIEKYTRFLSRKNYTFEKDSYRDNSKKGNSIVAMAHIGKEDVYCPTVYTDNHIFVSQGFLTGNCSEIFLADDEDHTFVCCLSSMNLTKYDEWKNTDAIQLAVYLLDAVITDFLKKSKNIEGLEKAHRFARKSRALGLGVLGWHELLQKKGIPFDSFQAMQLNAEVFSCIKEKAIQASKELAQEFGEPEWCIGMGIRNQTLTAIAPTLSNSIISGVFSEGIQPIISNIFAQKTSKGTFIRKNPHLVALLEKYGKNNLDTWTKINSNKGSVQGLDFLTGAEKELYKTARELNQFALIKQASQRQKYICQGQSLNVFFAIPQSSTRVNDSSDNDKVFTDIELLRLAKYIHEVHMEAWKAGVKSMYYFKGESAISTDSIYADGSECRACEG